MIDMAGNLLVVHGGGPTAVLNASLYGVIRQAQAEKEVGKIYGAIGGSEAILAENFLDMGNMPDEKIELLLQTPGTAIGSSRFPLEQEQYEAMVSILKKHDIRYVLFNGGNGTMDTCGKVSRVCGKEGIFVVGIPKTMDNDISIIDHAPGFPSAAKYIATVTKEVGADVKSLPIHVCIIEAMGRNAGWITAASALARKNPGDAPHLIYLPERNFCEEEFLEDVKKLYDELGGVVVVVSEGLRNEKGESIVPPIFQTDRAIYYGDVGAYLAELVIKKLGIKARSEKPGLCGRASMLLQSKVDREEAILAGREAVKAAVSEKTGVMVGIRRREGEAYAVEMPLIPVEEVMLHERVIPGEYINERGNDITESFVQWCRPLIDGELPEMVSFKDDVERKLKSRI